jgi:hypothetical protein
MLAGVCLNCVTRRRRNAAAEVRRPQARPGAHGTVAHITVVHITVVNANVPSGPAANGRASITASTLSGP